MVPSIVYAIGGTFDFYFSNNFLSSANSIILFLELTGLTSLITKGKIKNFIDFLTGVEVGLDTNARKNRVGKKNEKEIEKIIYDHFSCIEYIEIDKQLVISEFQEQGLLKNKKIDFIIKNKLNDKKVVIETSFYNSSGSKINETTKSFKKINDIVNNLENYYFLWVTGGKGLNSIKKTINENEKQFNFVKNKDNFVDSIKELLEIKD